MFDPAALQFAVRAGRAHARSGLPAAPTAPARSRRTPPLRARTAASLRLAARVQQRIAARLDSASAARCA
jgi:hypothetical protein